MKFMSLSSGILNRLGILLQGLTMPGKGRASSGAAKALLGKVYLTQKEYEKAGTVLQSVIDSGQYSLVNNYAVYLTSRTMTCRNHFSRSNIYREMWVKEIVLPCILFPRFTEGWRCFQETSWVFFTGYSFSSLSYQFFLRMIVPAPTIIKAIARELNCFTTR